MTITAKASIEQLHAPPYNPQQGIELTIIPQNFTSHVFGGLLVSVSTAAT